MISESLQSVLASLKKKPNNSLLILSQLDLLAPEELSTVYTWMLTSQVSKNSLNCFKELFKKNEKQIHLVYFLTNNIIEDPELFTSLINYLNEHDLLVLIENLLVKIKTNSSFTASLNQALLVFCAKLYTNQKSETPLHSWTHKTYTKELIYYLLHNPECLLSLTQTNSTLYAWITWSNYSLALKNRIDAVLNHSVLDLVELKRCALIWLEHFSEQPQHLYTIFSNLNLSESNRTLIGKENLINLKHAIWFILCPERSYDEKDFLTLFSPSNNEHFKSILSSTHQQQRHFSVYQQSLWLAKTTEELPKEYPTDQLIAILAHSIQNNSTTNWEKVGVWLEKQSLPAQLNFLKNLIKNDANVLANQYAYQLLTKCSQIKIHSNSFNEQELSWLIQYSRAEEQERWLDVVKRGYDAGTVNLGLLFFYLPADQFLLEDVLKNELFSNARALAALFAQVHLKPDSPIHLTSIIPLIKNKDPLWVRQFLNELIGSIKTINTHLMVLFILNNLILNPETALSAEVTPDKKIITDYLSLLYSLIKLAQTQTHQTELRQLIFNPLSILIPKEKDWATFIFCEPVFGAILAYLVNSSPSPTLPIKTNPLTTLFLNPNIDYLDVKTKADTGIQVYIHDLLLLAPANLCAQQFIILFKCLLPENKLRLARAVLSLTQAQTLHQQVLGHLSAVMPISELLPHLNQRKKNYLFKEIATHPSAQNELTDIQWYSLFTSLSGAEFTEILNDEQLSASTRTNYLTAFFKAYQRNPKLLGMQLQQWEISSAQLLVIANFALEENDHQLVQKLLEEKNYKLLLNLEHLSLIKFNKNSYLHKKTKEAILDGSLLVNLQLLQQLPPEDIYTALQQQTKEAAKIQTLSSLFTPFDTDKRTVLSLLHNARWLHRLPLIHSGLLEVVQFYKQKVDANDIKTTTALKQTAIYQKAIKPLLSGKAFETPEVLFSLYVDLQSYCTVMSPLAKEHVEHIKKTLLIYEKSLQTIQLYSCPRLHEQFKPDSSIASLNTSIPYALSSEDEHFLIRASTAHQEWIKKKSIDPKVLFINSLSSLIKERESIEQEELNHWLLKQIHFSALNLNLEDLNLTDYLIQFSPKQLASYLDAISEKLHVYQSHWEILTNLNSTEELFTQLFAFEPSVLTQLILTCDNLNLVFLKDFIVLIKTIKKLELNKEQSRSLFLDASISEHQEIRWLLLDLHDMKKRINHSERTLSQLYLWGYSYKSDAKDNHDRLEELTKRGGDIPHTVLAPLINSYVPAFTNQITDAPFFLNAIEDCLKKSSFEVLNQLDEKTISVLLNTALLQIDAYTHLLEQLLNSTHSKFCQQLIQRKLNTLINPTTDTTTHTDISQLNVQQLKQFEPQHLAKILAIARLLYFANPSKELLPFLNTETASKTQYSKKLFCSLASLYQCINRLNKSPDSSFDDLFSWLIKYGQTSLQDYLPVMEEWEHSQEIKDPAALFNWLCWKSILFAKVYDNRDILAKSLISWLNQHKTVEQLKSNDYLIKLLDYVAEENQLKALFTYASEHKELLNKEQLIWLCDSSFTYLSKEPELLEQIVELHSCTSLFSLLEHNKPHQFALLKAALKKEDYWQELLASRDAENNFVKQLSSYHFSVSQQLELIQCAANQQVKSQLILFFLTQSAYLSGLQEPSTLDKLNDKKEHRPSRLNGLVQQINPKHLSQEQINNLLPEAALSMLSCIAHFTHFTREQVRQLLAKVSQPAVLTYWLTHYAAMPNGFYMLAHFMSIAETSMVTEIKNLPDNTKEWFMHTMLEHLDLFDKSNKLLQESDKEEHLILALKKYLHGHNHTNYVHFIKQVTERLLTKNHVFSLATTQLLIMLHGDPQFKELNQATAYLVNHNLKTHAQSGSLDLFYDLGYVNIKSMIQLVPVKPKYPDNAKTGGLFSQLLTPLLAVDEGQVLLPSSIHPLIDALAEVAPSIKAFDYFLIHYKGDLYALQNALHHYLSFYAQQIGATELRTALYHISTLMTRQELAPAIRETIYQTFLSYPNLYDEHISYCMFLFNAQKTVQHFGLRGTKDAYNQVINLSTWALKKLDPKRHEDMITIANTALFEAKTELAFAEDDGFFSRLFRRFKRCWVYGWTGFLSPKAPSYVLPMSNTKTTENAVVQTQAMELTHRPPQELLLLLEELQKECSLPKLNELLGSLNQWEIKKNKPEEIKIREDLHRLFHRLLVNSVNNTALASWLQENQSALIMNRFHLLELFLTNNKQEQAMTLLNESNEDSPHLHYLSQELKCSIPSAVSSAENPQALGAESNSILLGTATSLAQSAWSWANAFSFFGKSATKDAETKPIDTQTLNPTSQ